MLTTTTTTTTSARAVEWPVGTVVDIIGGVYQGHIGRVKRYTPQRVVITLYLGLALPGAKKTSNHEVTIMASHTKARDLKSDAPKFDLSEGDRRKSVGMLLAKHLGEALFLLGIMEISEDIIGEVKAGLKGAFWARRGLRLDTRQ
jgi:hypothetical protein